jgi:hypothetical protein
MPHFENSVTDFFQTKKRIFSYRILVLFNNFLHVYKKTSLTVPFLTFLNPSLCQNFATPQIRTLDIIISLEGKKSSLATFLQPFFVRNGLFSQLYCVVRSIAVSIIYILVRSTRSSCCFSKRDTYWGILLSS